MILFNGKYSWDGKRTDEREPIAWFPGSCQLTLIDLSPEDKGVTYLKPYLCIFTQNNGGGHSISINPEKFTRRICADFSLDMEKVLWTERTESATDIYEVLIFTRGLTVGKKTLYTLSRREPIAGEIALIQKGLAACIQTVC